MYCAVHSPTPGKARRRAMASSRLAREQKDHRIARDGCRERRERAGAARRQTAGGRDLGLRQCVRPRKDISQCLEAAVLSGEWLAKARNDPRGERPRGGNGNLLAKQSAHGEFEPIPCAGHAQSRPRIEKRRERAIFREMRGDHERIGGNVEDSPQPRDDVRSEERDEADRRVQRIASPGPNHDNAVLSVDVEGTRISLVFDRLDAWNSAARQKARMEDHS